MNSSSDESRSGSLVAPRARSSAVRDALIIVGAAAALFLGLGLLDVEAAERVDRWITRYEPFELDELLFAVDVLLVGALVWGIRRWREHRSTMDRLERLKDGVQQLQGSFFIEDAEGRVLFANDACARELGYDRSDHLIGRRLSELVPEELFEQWRLAVEGTVQTGEARVLEYTHSRGDNARPEHRRSRIAPLRCDGDVVGIVGTSHDVTEMVRAREEARRNEDHLRAAQELARIGSWEWYIEEDEVRWTEQLHRIFGTDPEFFEADLSAFLSRVHPDDRDSVHRVVSKAIDSGEPYAIRCRVIRDDGQTRVIDASGKRDVDPDGRPLLRGVAQDVTEVVEARRRAEDLERRYQTLFSMSPMAFAVSTPDGTVADINRAFTDTLGYEPEEVVGRDVTDLDIWDDPSERDDAFDRLSEEKTLRRFPTSIRTASGETREVELNVDPIEIGSDRRLAWAVLDVTDRNEYRRELEQQALKDTLTGLPNRALLLEQLEQALKRGRRRDRPVALLFVDLDGFKAINDRYGHHAGDEVLCEVARRMSVTVRGEDTVGRLSGDEFVVLLGDAEEGQARKAAHRLLSALSSPVEVDGTKVDVGASIGAAVWDPSAESPFIRSEDLMHAADAAMYRVKQQRDGGVHVYTPEDRRPGERLGRKERLQAAIENDELVLYYQPIVDLRDQHLAGAEALVRWDHPERGLVPPGNFIPFAEDSGLIRPLDDWVMYNATGQAAIWMDDPTVTVDSDFQVAVNLSAQGYRESTVSRRIGEHLDAHDLSPERLQLEITERLALEETRPFAALRERGVGLAIDDFGTGYSSLLYLRHLDADVLKIDQYFVQEIEREEQTSIILRSVLSIGNHLDLDVIAEGVETAEQRDHLQKLGFRLAQGFHFARPMPVDAFTELLREERQMESA